MDVVMSHSAWSSYEQAVFDCFRSHFPRADIQKDVHLKGRYSKRMRQIDILITEETPAGSVRIVVDAKLYNRKLDVKTVEEFEGFLNDIGIEKGLLISNKGYSRSALRRAFYCPSDLELDILDFSELKKWQGFEALPYAGDNAFLVPAPLGWVIDSTQGNGGLCTMYRRGLDIKTAMSEKEFLYINFWDRKKTPLTAAELDKLQIDQMKLTGLSVEVSHQPTIKRNDANTRLRFVTVKQYKCIEVTGFIELKDTILFAVLLTPVEKQKQNIRRLEHVLESAIPIYLKKDNTALIDALKAKLDNTKSIEERATILLDIGHWYRDMKQLAEAKQFLEESVSLFPCYAAIKELLFTLDEVDDRARILELLQNLLLLDLTNSTVFNDALYFAHENHLDVELLALIQELSNVQANDSLSKASCLFYAAQLLLSNDTDTAKSKLAEARKIFGKLFPPEHHVFKAIRLLVRQCKLVTKTQ